MGRMHGAVKGILATIAVVAAALSLDVVDVIKVSESITEQTKGMIERVELDGDETGLFDEKIDPESGEVIILDEFARPTDKVVPAAVAYEEPVDGEPDDG